MTESMNDVCGIAITRAVRDVELNGVKVEKGQTIGLINDDLATAGDDELEVVMQTFSAAEVEDPELLTVFVGEEVSDDEAQALRSALPAAWPDAEIEMHSGGQ